MEKKELICISCPIGCNLSVEIKKEDIEVFGNRCKRGEKYAIDEITFPKRVLTTSVKIKDNKKMLSVKSKEAIPKEDLFEAMKILKKVEVKVPIKVGDVIEKNILNTGVDIIATRDMLF